MSPRLGLDLGGTSIKWVLLGAGDVILDQGSVPTPNTGVEATLTVIADLAAKHAEPAIGGAGVGLAVPGSVDPAAVQTNMVLLATIGRSAVTTVACEARST